MGDAIVRDLARKCSDDVSDAIHRNMQLVESRRDMAALAFAGAAIAVAVATGAFIGVREDAGDADAWADALMAELRPLVLSAVQHVQKPPGPSG